MRTGECEQGLCGDGDGLGASCDLKQYKDILNNLINKQKRDYVALYYLSPPYICTLIKSHTEGFRQEYMNIYSTVHSTVFKSGPRLV